MRILHLIKHCEHSNGHVNVMVDLAWAHARAGHSVTVASAGGHYVPFLERNGVAHRTVATGRSPLTLVTSFGRLVALGLRERPDVIHAHMMSSAVFGYAASRSLRVPLVTTVHNSFDQHSGLMRLGDAIVAVSEAERRLLLSRGYPGRKVVTIRNGTVGSPRETMADGSPLPEMETPSIVTVCGLHQRKGVHHLIDAFARVADAHPAWHLNIIGKGPDAAPLASQVEACGLTARVHFLGPVLTPKPLLEKAEIFVLASLADPSALVLPEARAAGCAMVATAVGGTAEALAQGRAGQLVPPGDPAAMAAVFDTLMSRPGELAAWRQRARDGLDEFTLARTASQYLALYERLARPGSGARRRPLN